MGLLDDAIREHIELKRRHGAEPGEIARVEEEALSPAVREAPEEAAAPPETPPEPAAEPTSGNADEAPAALAASSLEKSGDDTPAPSSPPEPDIAAGIFEEEDEKPRAEDETDEGEEPDVLEETPDFLQETPEHDRLWFEQKPPRDFDFDG